MAGRPSDTSWFPEPRQRLRPQQPLGSQLVGWLLPLVAVAGVVGGLALAFGSNHGTTRTPGTGTCKQASGASCRNGTAPTPAQETQAQTARQAFESCIKSAGGGGGGGGGGFGGRFGPSSKTREAFAVCSSLLRGGRSPNAPAQTTPAATPTPPVA